MGSEMNLTGQKPHVKGQTQKKGNNPTAKQRKRWSRVAELGCVVEGCRNGNITIHHCGTGIGVSKDHDKVIPLCWEHHLGESGIDGKRISKRQWEKINGTEEDLMMVVKVRLREF